MIVTVTPNPSIDRTLYIDRLDRGTFIRAARSSSEAGGKGINVGRALTTHGVPAIAVVPASAASGAVLRRLLGDTATLDTVAVRGEMRTNVSIVEPDGTTTKINETGPTLDPADETALADAVLRQAASSTWIAGCGSIPPGMSSDFYARLAADAPSGVRLAIDTDGEPLRASVGARVALLKPNREELERLVGRSLPTLGEVVDAAAEIVADGTTQILVSLGADGAVVVTARSAVHGEAPGAPVVNTVGAGDALLAGFLACGADTAALPEAIAWSVAACASAGTEMRQATAADRALVVVHPTIDRSRRLVS